MLWAVLIVSFLHNYTIQQLQTSMHNHMSMGVSHYQEGPGFYIWTF